MCKVRASGRAGAFTLVELLVVLSILAILAAVLVPAVSGATEFAYDAICRSNLRELCNAIQSHAGLAGGKVTPAQAWVTAVVQMKCGAALKCPKDEFEREGQGTGDLESVYILQFHYGGTEHHDVSYISDILSGGMVPDFQIWARYPAGGIDQAPKGGWPSGSIPPLKENQAFIGIDNDAAVRITLGRKILIESYMPVQRRHSRHWVMRGAGTIRTPLAGGDSPQDDDDEELLHLFGWDYDQVDPRSPCELKGKASNVSYGMNALIGGRRWKLDQLLLTDAFETVIDLDRDGNYEEQLEEVIAPRHWDRYLNVVDVGGSARPMTLYEFRTEVENPKGLWDP